MGQVIAKFTETFIIIKPHYVNEMIQFQCKVISQYMKRNMIHEKLFFKRINVLGVLK